MKLELEIHQSKFTNEYQKLLMNIIFTSNWVENNLKKFFDEEGITTQQYNILRILRGANESLSTLQIKNRMLDKGSDASRIVDRIVAKGWVKKITNNLDKRLVSITITHSGLALVNKMDKNDINFINTLQNLSEKEAKKLNTLLDKIRN